MKSLRQILSVSVPILMAVFGTIGTLPEPAQAEEGRMEIVGDYRYAYHEPETSAEAKNTACREALRVAVGRSSFLHEHTASLSDSALLREVVQLIASHYVKDVQIVEQTEKGRTVSCKVRGSVQLAETEGAIKTRLVSTGNDSAGIDQNRALRVLSVREDTDGAIVVVYQALKRLDWLSTAYDGSLRESADIMIDFYNDQGSLIKTDRYPARKTASGEDVMNPGSIGTKKIAKPLNAKSYRVWVVK